MFFPNIRENHIFGKAKTKFECPIVAVTACASKEVNEQAIKIGIKQVIPKPVDVKVLAKVLKDYYYIN
jgi:CheY-like chemotaxis protein